jgi:hypothetical protein
MTPVLPLAIVPRLGLLLLCLSAPLQAQKGLPEPGAGLSFQPPKGWIEMPGGSDRGACLRMFAAPRAVASTGDSNHTPLLRVFWFPSGGDDTKDVVESLPRMTPYRSLEDFARRGLGSKDVSAEPAKAAGIAGKRVIAKAIGDGTVLIGQTLPMTDGEAAVGVQVLGNQADKFKKEIDAVLGSLETLPRVAATAALPPWRADTGWAEKDPAAKLAARRTWAEGVVAATAKAPGQGFKVSKSKHWTVASSADAAFTKKVVTAAEAARELLVKQFPELTKEPPLPAVLRIFDNTDLQIAWQIVRNDSRDYDAQRRELHCVNDRENSGPTSYGPVLRAVLWQVFDDLDEGTLPALPRWLDNGLWEFCRSSTFDGKKFEFAPGDVERGRIDYYRQKNEKMPELWQLIQERIQISPTDGSVEKNWGYTPECARLMRWWWLHDGQQAFGKPTLFADYVKALGLAWQRKGPDPTADIAMVLLTEAQRKDRNTRYYAFRDAMLVETNNIVLPLHNEQWDAINEKWYAFNKAFK